MLKQVQTLRSYLKTLSKDRTYICICYEPTGEKLYEGSISTIPKHMLKYYVGYESIITSSVYIEVHETKEYWK